MFHAMKTFFLFQSNLPMILKKLFENELVEASMWRLHSVMSMFHTNIQETERERNSILEILTILHSVCQVLQDRIKEGFLPLKTQEILSKMKKDGLGKEADLSVKDTCSAQEMCFEYLLK
jgi:hypothetical protein